MPSWVPDPTWTAKLPGFARSLFGWSRLLKPYQPKVASICHTIYRPAVVGYAGRGIHIDRALTGCIVKGVAKDLQICNLVTVAFTGWIK